VAEAFRRSLSIEIVKCAWFYTYISLTGLYDVVIN